MASAPARLALHQEIEEIEQAAAVGQTQHVADLILADLARHAALVAQRQRPIEQRQPVAHRAVGGARDQRQRRPAPPARPRPRRSGRNSAASASASTRRRSKRWQRDSTVTGTLRISVVAKMNFTWAGGSSSVFSKRVEGLGREHVHFVDDVDLVARLHRRVAHALDQLADVADAGAAGRIHLDDVDMPVLGDGEAMGTLAAGDGGRAALAVGADAVEGAGEDARRRRLADAAHAGQHVALGDAAAGDGIGQRAHQRFLADHVGEGRGPVFARQHAIGRAAAGWSVIGSVGHALGVKRSCGTAACGTPDGEGAVGGRHATRTETRYGCFLPDLTGLARRPSAANLPAPISDLGARGARANRGQGIARLAPAGGDCLPGRGHASLAPCRKPTSTSPRPSTGSP